MKPPVGSFPDPTSGQEAVTKAHGDASYAPSVVVASTVLGADAQSLVLTGLDGDADGIYELTGRILLDTAAGNVILRPNSSTTALKSMQCEGNSEINEATTWRLADWLAVSTYHAFYFKVTLYAARTVNSVAVNRRYHYIGTRDAADAMESYTGGGVWGNADNNLTSISLISNVVDGILTGSDIVVRRII